MDIARLRERLRERAERIYDGHTPRSDNIFAAIAAELSEAADALESTTQQLEWAELERDTQRDITDREAARADAATQRAERAEKDNEFLHKRRGELAIERDRYKAALGQYPEGRDVILAALLSEREKTTQRAERLHAALQRIYDGAAVLEPGHRKAVRDIASAALTQLKDKDEPKT